MKKTATAKMIDEALEQFERMIKELIDLGYSPDMAVRVAYKDYPIMKLLEAPLTADMVQNFNNAYHGVLVANRVAGHMPFNYSTQSISEAMQEAWTSDGLTLSTRLHNNAAKIQRDTAEVIRQSLKRGKSIKQMARAIFEGYGNGGTIQKDKLPKYIEMVRRLKWPNYLNDDEVAQFKHVLRQTERQVRQNTTPSLRAAYTGLIKAVDEASAIDLSKSVNVAVQEKARYNAERIARTEAARAYADGQMLRYNNDDDVVALKWQLNSRHHVCDICDVYANADFYGLGKGIYPKDKFPTLPAHPHCLCKITPVYDFEVDIHKAEENIEEGGKRYINSLSKVNQERILGVNGREHVQRGKESWTQRARGWTREVFRARAPKESIIQSQPKIIEPKNNNVNNPYIVDKKRINSKSYRDNFELLPYKSKVNDALHREAIKCFNASNGRNVERLALIDARNGKTIGYSVGTENSNKVIISKPTGYTRDNSIVIIHNHPNNSGFSRADIDTYIKMPQIHGAIVVTGNGKIYSVSSIDRDKPIERSFKMFYNIYEETYGLHRASDMALKDLHRKGWLIYEKRE